MTFRSAPRALATATAALLALTGVTACSNDDSPAGATRSGSTWWPVSTRCSSSPSGSAATPWP